MIDEIRRQLEKIPQKTYYRIGEVATITAIKPYVLRFWETEFTAMAPPKSRSKQRMYRRKDIETILTIKHLLYDERFTIEGARKRLVELAREQRAQTDPQQIRLRTSALSQIRAELVSLRELIAPN
ncbi:MAG: MerR family transcriptional regulator [bacterium]|nr:MerR family transcriptional regulator [bacterium]